MLTLILFLEASSQQAETAMEILDEFYCASGLAMNLSKSKIYFSKGVARPTRLLLAHKVGMTISPTLGRYLGMLLISGRKHVRHFSFILDKMQDKLTGWNASQLSLAGQATLARSVLCAMGVYFMQTCRIPLSICDGIEALTRRFIWGSSTTTRKVHLVDWGIVQTSKEGGGLGLRNPRISNKAFLMSIIWHIIS